MKILSFLFCYCLLIFSSNSFCKGIVIADEKFQLLRFETVDTMEIVKFADSISMNYTKVILHLGTDYVFNKGNIYFEPIRQKNLQVFSNRLAKNKTKLYLWFLDAYGNDQFQKIYSNHSSIITTVSKKIKELNLLYSGVYIDLEWINDGAKVERANNSKLVEILKFLENSFSTKEIGFFCSLIDSEKVNHKRGYSFDLIKQTRAYPIVMLYIKDGGFYFENNEIQPYLNDIRLTELKAFYNQHKWETCISLESAWIVKDKNEVISLRLNPEEVIRLKKNIIPENKKKYNFFILNQYTISSDILIKQKNRKDVLLSKTSTVWSMKVNEILIDADNFLWEYYSLQTPGWR